MVNSWSGCVDLQNWSDCVFIRACIEADMIDPTAFVAAFLRKAFEGLDALLADPKNWRRVRFRHTVPERRGAARVVAALKRAKPGVLVRI
jgi:hypothetical protein